MAILIPGLEDLNSSMLPLQLLTMCFKMSDIPLVTPGNKVMGSNACRYTI